jgi:hypothetical protein
LLGTTTIDGDDGIVITTDDERVETKLAGMITGDYQVDGMVTDGISTEVILITVTGLDDGTGAT